MMLLSMLSCMSLNKVDLVRTSQMSLAFRFSPVGTFIYGCLYDGGGFPARIGFQKNFGFSKKKKNSRPSGLRFVTNQNLRFLKSNHVDRLCKLRNKSNSDAAYCADSSFTDSLGDSKDCGRVEGVKKEAANVNDSDTNTGYSHRNVDSRGNQRCGGDNGGSGNGDNRGNHGGGGDNGGTGSGGLGEFANWEGVIWLCWQIYKVWTYYFNSADISSSKVAPSAVGNIPVKPKECAKKMAGPDSEGLQSVLEPMAVTLFGEMFVPCMIAAVGICAVLLAGASLFGCVVALLVWVCRSLWP